MSIDLGVAIADESAAVAQSNDEIIQQLPECMLQLEAAIEKMDSTLKKWFAFTSYEFRGSESVSYYATNGPFSDNRGTTTTVDMSNVVWSFDSGGNQTAYSRALGVNNTSSRAAGVARTNHGNANKAFTTESYM